MGVDEDVSSGELARTLWLSIFCTLLTEVVEFEGDGTGEGVNRSAASGGLRNNVSQKCQDGTKY